MEEKRNERVNNVLVDSDAFVALTKKDDGNHEKAIEILEALLHAKVSFLTSNYVVAETITVISQRVSHRAALLFVKEIKSQDASFLVRWVDEDIEKMAIEIFKNQTSKNVSFVDCTNIAIIQIDKIDAIFSFDKIYKRNGIRMIKP